MKKLGPIQVLFLLSIAGCAANQPIANPDHGLEPAATSKELSQSIASRSRPNVDSQGPKLGEKDVSAPNFDSARAKDSNTISKLEGSRDLSSTDPALGLELAPKSNEFSQAIATRALPNAEPSDSERAWKVVPARDFDSAIANEPKKTSQLEGSAHFFDAAQVANDGWSAGVFVNADKLEHRAPALVKGVNWIVVEDARIDPATNTLFATRYRLVNQPLMFMSSFVGWAPAIFQKVGDAGTGRCCGPEKLCSTEGGPENPQCPGGWCEGRTQMYTGSLGAGNMRQDAGLPGIPAHTYDRGELFPSTCLPAVDPKCMRSNPNCTAEIPGRAPWGSWSADVPIASGACGGVGNRPTTGRIVPKQCLYRSGAIDMSGPAVSYRSPECDGQCYECEAYKPPIDANLRPRQCDLMRPMPGDPPGLPGSGGTGVCESTPEGTQLEQATLRFDAGVSPGMSGIGGCRTGQVPNPSGVGHMYVKICIECSPTQCGYKVQRAESPLAEGSANQNTPTTCNMTEAKCGPAPPPPPSPATPASPTTKPPLTSTSPPPPQANTPKTDRSDQPPAADPTPEAQTAVNQKSETTDDPISVSSGAFELRHVDLSFPGPVRPLEFVRTYNSRSRDRSVLGSNWSHNWDVRLVPLNDENRPSWADPYCAGSPHETTCIMLYVGGTPHLFYKEFMTGVFVPQAGITSTLVPLVPRANSAGTPDYTPDYLTGWLLESADGHNLTFDRDGYLTKDVDRFGNGFVMQYEPTPSGLLFMALCPRGIIEIIEDPRDKTRFATRPQQGPVYDADSLDCRALGSVVGVRAPFIRQPSGVATLNFAEPQGVRTEFRRAKALVESLQNHAGRQPGAPMPWGPRVKRVTRVKEIVATKGSQVTKTGRELQFDYYPDDAGPLLGTVAGLPRAGLLRAVRGPAGAQISFEYQSAESAASHPVFLNEAFLVQAMRTDGVAPTGLRKTPKRALRFTYAWRKNAVDPKGLATALGSYRRFWEAQSNCTFTPVDNCSAKGPVAMNIHDHAAALQDVEANFRAEVADNIIRVDNGPIVESETRYDTDPFSLSFDRAVKQRWGSTSTTPMASAAPDWDTQLPEATLAFSEALPIKEGTDDVTTSFLPPAIANRYELEAFPPKDAFSKAQSSGMLLAPNSPDGTVIPNQNPPIAEGTYVPVAKDPRPACPLQKLPILRSRLPGYRPSFEYYDLPPAQTPDADSATTGINVATFALKRSRLSCEVLARAQTSDARTTDLIWTWQNVNGQMVANRSLGRRQYVTLNANRICGWTRETNRDGVVRYQGINFQGRPLVDALQGDDGQWRFGETLYNADGNVIAQRRTLPESTPWSDGRGDTRYSYLDLVQPNAGANPVQPLPWYWARRNNILKVTDRPRGSTVTEYQETGGGTTPIDTTGRFTRYTYEPIFNQVREVRTGWIDQQQAEHLHATTEVVYDYQEGLFDTLWPILERQRALGYDHETDTNLNLRMGAIAARQGMVFRLGDLNGDGKTTIFGLPSLVYYRPAAGGVEVTAYRWNRGGRLVWVQTADGAAQSRPGSMPTGGSITEFEYLPLGALSGAVSPNHTGFLGAVHHVPRKIWQASDGPSRAPCPHLAGPYQWLLPSTCSSTNLADQIKARHFVPTAVAKAIADQHALARDGTTEFQYHPTGQVKRATGPDARATEFERDVDGRVTIARLLDHGTEHTKIEITYDSLMHPIEVRRTSGATYLGSTQRRFDEESHLLFECDEFVVGGCAHASHGALPAAGVSRTYWYSPEGLLQQSQDAEGLWTTFTRDPRTWITRVETFNPNAQQDGVRTEAVTHDDDGNLLSRNYGGVLWEFARYDGYGRLIRTQDTQSRWVGIHRSPHENLVRLEVRETEFGPATWYHWFERDPFGRMLRQYVNGTSPTQLVQEVKRRPGGAIWWSRGVGKRPQLVTHDADGAVVWSQDEDAEITTLATGYPATRDRSQTTIRANGWMTTSVSTTLNVLGLAEGEIVSGSGSGRTTLTRKTRYLRDKSGFVLRQDDPDGKSTEFEYDLVGRMRLKREWVPTIPPTQQASSYSHDRRGALTSITDMNGELTKFEYNAFGQLRFERSPARGGQIVSEYQYDFLGRPSRTTPGGTPGPQTTYEHVYNAKNQLWKLTIDDSTTPLRDYTYDVLGRPSTATNYNLGLAGVQPAEKPVINSLEYDWLGRISLESVQIGGRPLRATASTFKANANLPWSPLVRRVTRPDGSVAEEEFDSFGRITRLARGSGAAPPITEFEYRADLLLSQSLQSSTGRVRSDIEYDALAQPLAWQTQINGAAAIDIRVLRDAAGRIGSYARLDWRPPSVTTPEKTWRGYTYDSMRRVAKIHESNDLPNLSRLVTHSLKATEIDAAAATVAQTNGFNAWTYRREPRVGSVLAITSSTAPSRLTASPRLRGYQLPDYFRGNAGAEPLRLVVHDEVGRVTSDGLDEYGWSVLSELSSVTPIGNAGSPSQAEQLQYDGFGRLVARRDQSGQLVEEYTHDGDQMVVAWNQGGLPQWSAIWGPGLDHLVSIRKGDDTFLALHDGRGSIGGFINEASQRVAANSDYTPEGRTKWTTYSTTGSVVSSCNQLSSPVAACNEGPHGIPFGFHAAFKSKNTGLMYFRNRWLSSRTGEWLSRDAKGSVDSYNLYSLAAFDSVNYIDPFGLSTCGSATDGVDCGGNNVALESGNLHMEIVKTSSFDEELFNQIIAQYSYKGEPTHERFGYRQRSAWEEITSPGSAGADMTSPRLRVACGGFCRAAPLFLISWDIFFPVTVSEGIGAAGVTAAAGAVANAGEGGLMYQDPVDRKLELPRRREINRRIDRDLAEEDKKQAVAAAAQSQQNEKGKARPQDQKPPGSQSTPATPPEPQKPPDPEKPVAAKGTEGLRNAHLAGSVHPKTGVPFDKDGYADFSGHAKVTVKIKQTGTRAGDFRAANKEAGFKNTPEGYTWHHHQDRTTMQLVPRDIHAQTGHTGGFQRGP